MILRMEDNIKTLWCVATMNVLVLFINNHAEHLYLLRISVEIEHGLDQMYRLLLRFSRMSNPSLVSAAFPALSSGHPNYIHPSSDDLIDVSINRRVIQWC